MKKILIIAVFLLLFLPVVSADDLKSYIDDIRVYPSRYSVVTGSNPDIEEKQLASELARYLGVQLRPEPEVKIGDKYLIIIGTKKTNPLVDKRFREARDEKILVKAKGTDLLISAQNPKDLASAGQIVIQLAKQSPEIQFLSPLALDETTLLVYLSLGLAAIVVAVLVLLLVRSKKKKKAATPQFAQVMGYINKEFSKGYSKGQIREALMKLGWNEKIVDELLKRPL